MSTFVCVGNALQPFGRLLDGVMEISSQLPQPIVVQYGAASEWANVNCEAIDYMEMTEFSSYVTQSTLLIMHAGAGSIIHAVEAGKVPVVVPRRASYGEHVDDHQVEFCRELEQASRVVVCHEIRDLEMCVMQARERQRGHGAEQKEPRLVSLVHEI
ncbi:hypothetical protein N9V84_08930, partial [Verrucomicrobiales bacterium]|nr:hypothetical protein [Verrucomicrobiales bacterium]